MLEDESLSALKEFYDSHYSSKGKVKTRRKTAQEREQYPTKRINGHKAGSDNYIKKDKTPIQNKRRDDDTPDGRYRDNKDVTGERPVGDRGSAPPNTPKEKAKRKRIQDIKRQDAEKQGKSSVSSKSSTTSPTSNNNKPSTSPKTAPNSNDGKTTVTNTPTDSTKPKSVENGASKGNDKPSLAKRAWDATKKKGSDVSNKVSKGYKKAKDVAHDAGETAGETTGKVVDTAFNRLNKNDHIKK